MGHALRVAGAALALVGGLLVNARAGDAESCARPNVPATIVRAVEPDVPAMSQQQGISGTVQVAVSLDASSRVTGTRIVRSPSAILNAAALAAARASTYQTEIRDCRPIAVDYVLNLDFAAQDGNGSPPAPRAFDGRPIAVISAQGVATRTPDVASFTASIVTNDDVAGTATAKNNAIYAAIRVQLGSLGIDDSALRTHNFSMAFIARPTLAPAPAQPRVPIVAPRYGYVATRLLAVTLNDVGKTDAVISALLAPGVTSIGNVQFALRDRGAAYAEALASALKDAADQARVIARASHLRIAGIKQIQTGQNPLGGPVPPTPVPAPPLPPRRNDVQAPASTSMNPAPVEVRASVTVTYVFKGGPD